MGLRPVRPRAEHVVLPPALRVLQRLIGAVDEFETLLVGLGFNRRPCMTVRMEFACQFPVGTFYFVLGGVPANAEEGVVVILSQGWSSSASL